MRLQDIIPDTEGLLALQPEELAQAVLKVLVSQGERNGLLNSYNFSLPGNFEGYGNYREVSRAAMEAWVWLEREGLIAPRPGEQHNWVFVTRRGHEAAASEDWAAYRKADQLPRQFLHGSIAAKVWPTFLRGDYDTAVFQAYKEIEVKVRDAIGERPDTVGVDLMRRAFNPESGKLTDREAPKGEQEALAHLFAGAVGSYKNPHSHRTVVIDAQEASEMIILASHLLRIVEERAWKKDA